MPKIFVYGFSRFGPYNSNMSEKIVKRLPNRKGLYKKIFPVLFDRKQFEQSLVKIKPDIIIGLGQHPRARKIRIERRAVNRIHSKKGKTNPQQISPRGPKFIYTTLQYKRRPGMTVSYDAGTYACNFSMYVIGEYCTKNDCQFAFFHIPLDASLQSALKNILGVISDCLRKTKDRK